MDANGGARLVSPGAEFRIECRSFKRIEKNTLRGFVSLTVAPSRITINDVCLHEKAGRRWLSFPAKPYQDKDGKQQWVAYCRDRRQGGSEALSGRWA
jgi:hypothetical protein